MDVDPAIVNNAARISAIRVHHPQGFLFDTVTVGEVRDPPAVRRVLGAPFRRVPIG